MSRRTGSLRRVRDKQRIYDSLVQAGPATCDEIEARLGMIHQTASARLKDLQDLNWVENIGTAKTRNDGTAVVWQARPASEHFRQRRPTPSARATRYYAVGIADTAERVILGPYYSPDTRTTAIRNINFPVLFLLRLSRGVITIQDI